MIEGQGFAGKIGEAALLADENNLETLVKAFPELFMDREFRRPRLTLLSFTSETQGKLAR
jgi:hypothetical protein